MDCKYNPTGASAPVSSSLINSSAHKRADKCHRKVAFVVYIAVLTRLLTAIYTTKYNAVACRLVYDLAPSVLNKRSAVKPVHDLFPTKEEVVPININM